MTLTLATALVSLCVSQQVPAAESTSLPLEQPQRTRLADGASPLSDFTLTDHEGRAARLSDFQGRTTLVFFGFTNCPSICPTEIKRLRQVQAAFADEASVPLGIMISVDGDRDTPEAMRAFLEQFGGEFVGLTGPRSTVRPIADEFRAVFFEGGPTDTHGGYNVEHTSQVYLVDNDGYLRAVFYSAPVHDMVAVTRQLLR